MIYSINNCIVFFNSGVEHAEFQRIHLFNRFHHPMKLLLDEYDPKAHWYLKKSGLSDDEVINLYDYYQDALLVPSRRLTYKDLSVVKGHHVMKFPGYYVVRHKSGYIYCIYNFSPTYRKGQIKRMDCFYHKKCRYSIVYDIRGFASKCILWSKDQRVKKIGFLTPQKKIAFTATFSPLKQSNNSTEYYEIYHIRGHKPIISRSHLIEAFMNDICKRSNILSGKPTIFISDRWWRNENVDDILENIKYPHYTAYYMHYTHEIDHNTEENFGRVIEQGKYLTPMHSYNALICSTPRQSHDIRKQYQVPRPIFTIPVGVQNPNGIEHPLPMNKRHPYSIVCATRAVNGEGLKTVIKAFCLAKRDIPKLTLDIYGKMGALSSELRTEIETDKKKYQLGNSLRIHGYITNVPTVYRHGQLTMATAPHDAFNISLLGALSQGCPGIAYASSYGPGSLIKDGINGYLVDNVSKSSKETIRYMSDKIVNYFTHPKLMQELSDQTYRYSKHYSPDNVWKMWEKLIDDAHHTFGQK